MSDELDRIKRLVKDCDNASAPYIAKPVLIAAHLDRHDLDWLINAAMDAERYEKWICSGRRSVIRIVDNYPCLDEYIADQIRDLEDELTSERDK